MPFFSNFAETLIPFKKFNKIWFVAKEKKQKCQTSPGKAYSSVIGTAEPETLQKSRSHCPPRLVKVMNLNLGEPHPSFPGPQPRALASLLPSLFLCPRGDNGRDTVSAT